MKKFEKNKFKSFKEKFKPLSSIFKLNFYKSKTVLILLVAFFLISGLLIAYGQGGNPGSVTIDTSPRLLIGPIGSGDLDGTGVSPALILHLPMDRGEVENKTPYIGYGTNYGAYPVEDRHGGDRGAMNFNGNSYINCGDNENSLVMGSASFSLGAWAQVSQLSEPYNFIVSFGDGSGGKQASLGITNGGKLFISGYSNPILTTTYTVDNVNDWHHYFINYDGGSRQAKFYVDGDLKETGTISLNTTVGKCRIGSHVGEGGLFRGKIDDVRIYNEVLSDNKVASVYDAYNYNILPLCKSSVIDGRDGNVYNVVQIGEQCWTTRNAAYLPSVNPGTDNSITEPRYYVYGYNGTSVVDAKASTNYQTHGTLYNFDGAMNACPAGFHLPTDEELNDLEKTVVSKIDSAVAQYSCSTSETGWRRCADNNNTDAGGVSVIISGGMGGGEIGRASCRE